MRPFLLCGLMAVYYLVVTLNYRAIAKGHIPATLATEILVTASGFLIIQRVGAAASWAEMFGYMVGGCIGSTAALLLSKRMERDSCRKPS